MDPETFRDAARAASVLAMELAVDAQPAPTDGFEERVTIDRDLDALGTTISNLIALALAQHACIRELRATVETLEQRT